MSGFCYERFEKERNNIFRSSRLRKGTTVSASPFLLSPAISERYLNRPGTVSISSATKHQVPFWRFYHCLGQIPGSVRTPDSNTHAIAVLCYGHPSLVTFQQTALSSFARTTHGTQSDEGLMHLTFQVHYLFDSYKGIVEHDPIIYPCMLTECERIWNSYWSRASL